MAEGWHGLRDACRASLRAGYAVALLGLLLLSGCASGPNANPRDPLEPFNRGVYQFNDALDEAVMKPVATAYQFVTPAPVRRGVGNFFQNLKEPWSFINSLLQFKALAAAETMLRFSINTLVGLGGIIDVASELNIERHKKDFGLTLGYWGVPSGPYLVLPLLGPSTVRDTVTIPADVSAGILIYVANVPVRNSAVVLEFVDERAKWLKTTNLLDESALDKYSFVRDAFLQRRRNDIYDGNPPEEEDAEVSLSQPDAALSRAETQAQAPTSSLAETLTKPGLPGDEKVKP